MCEVIQFPEPVDPPDYGVWMCACGSVAFFIITDGQTQRFQCEVCGEDQRPILARLWEMPVIELGHHAEVITIQDLQDGTWQTPQDEKP
jgi:hypothetical protein